MANDQQVARMQAELAELRTQLTAFGDVLRDEAESTGQEAWSRVRSASRRARTRAREAGHYARSQAEHATETTRGQITQHPLTSVGAAFAAGILLGTILGRR